MLASIMSSLRQWRGPVRGIRQFYKWNSQQKVERALQMSYSARLADVVVLCKQAKILHDCFSKQRRQLYPEILSNNKPYFDACVTAKSVIQGFSNADIECIVGGSLAVMVYTLPQMTDNVVFNVDISMHDANAESILRNECAQNDGWEFIRLSKLRSPAARELDLGVAIIEVHGATCELYLNGCTPSRFVHQNAQEVPLENGPPASLKLAPSEAIAFYKTLTLERKNKRFHAEVDDVQQLMRCCTDFDRAWVRAQLVAAVGDADRSVKWFDEWAEEVDNEVGPEKPEGYIL